MIENAIKTDSSLKQIPLVCGKNLRQSKLLLKLKKDKSSEHTTIENDGQKRASSASECTGPKKKLVLRRVAYRPPEKDK